MVHGLGIMIDGLWFKGYDAWFMVWGLWLMVQGLGFRAEGVGCKVYRNHLFEIMRILAPEKSPDKGGNRFGFRVLELGCRVL